MVMQEKETVCVCVCALLFLWFIETEASEHQCTSVSTDPTPTPRLTHTGAFTVCERVFYEFHYCGFFHLNHRVFNHMQVYLYMHKHACHSFIITHENHFFTNRFLLKIINFFFFTAHVAFQNSIIISPDFY